MKLHLASTAELYAEHRRTGSTRKRQRIAAELQRRHDEIFQPPGVWPLDRWYLLDEFEVIKTPLGDRLEPRYFEIPRVDFALLLSGIRSPQSAIE